MNMFRHSRRRRCGGSAASEDSSGSGLFQGTSQSRQRQQQLLDCLESQQEAPQQEAPQQGEEGQQEAPQQDEEVDPMGAGGASDAPDGSGSGSGSTSFRYY